MANRDWMWSVYKDMEFQKEVYHQIAQGTCKYCGATPSPFVYA